jgi:hypothetical protein
MEERGVFQIEQFAEELARASENRELGTTVWFENDRIQVWEVRLEPGQRGAFHIHDQTYFWVVVEPGRGLQRFANGTQVTRDYTLGETRYLEHSPQKALIHDLENVGETTLRFVTVMIKSV